METWKLGNSVGMTTFSKRVDGNFEGGQSNKKQSSKKNAFRSLFVRFLELFGKNFRENCDPWSDSVFGWFLNDFLIENR